MINSEIYMPSYDKSGRAENFKRIFSLNPGLIKGQGRVLSDTRVVQGRDKVVREEALMPVCDQLQKCKIAANEQQIEMIDDLFICHNKTKLTDTKRSWILPRILGGLDLPRGSILSGQRVLAACVLSDQFIGGVGESLLRPDYLENSIQKMNEVCDSLNVEYHEKTMCFSQSELDEHDARYSRIIDLGDKCGPSRYMVHELPKISHLFLGQLIPKGLEDYLEINENMRFVRCISKANRVLSKFQRDLGRVIDDSQYERTLTPNGVSFSVAFRKFEQAFNILDKIVEPTTGTKHNLFLKCVGGRAGTVSPILFW
jgi:hypothetical protein